MLAKLAVPVVIITLAIVWRWRAPNDPLTEVKLLDEYDYIIVGGGSAGTIVAARLTEDPNVKVALLEAGSDSDYRGGSGHGQEPESPAFLGAAAAFLQAAETQGFEIGFENGENMTNKVLVTQANVRRDGSGERTEVTYLGPAMSRENLDILTKVYATKVLFEGKRAVGVQYMDKDALKSVRCRKEVILSAGAVGSPHILLLSGVGPKQHLQNKRIPLIADLPVGQNMHHHIHVHPAIVTLKDRDIPASHQPGLMDKMKDFIFGPGPPTSGVGNVGVLGMAFSRSKHQPEDHQNPYLQYALMPAQWKDGSTTKTIEFNMKPEIHKAIFAGLNGKNGLTLQVALQQPTSVGYLHLNTTDPLDRPLINPNYLAEDIDMEMLIDGVRIARKVMSAEPLEKKLGAKLVELVPSKCAKEKFDSDEYWKCYIRQNALPFYSLTSTCRMGPQGNGKSVVDPKLRVHGLDGIRVVDASIMPQISTGNTYLHTMMIAERAADIIKEAI